MLNEKLYIVNIDGIDVYVDFTTHSKARGKQREIEINQVLMALQKDGAEQILDLHQNDEGVLYDAEQQIAIVFRIFTDACLDINIQIITVWNEKEYHFIPYENTKQIYLTA